MRLVFPGGQLGHSKPHPSPTPPPLSGPPLVVANTSPQTARGSSLVTRRSTKETACHIRHGTLRCDFATCSANAAERIRRLASVLSISHRCSQYSSNVAKLYRSRRD